MKRTLLTGEWMHDRTDTSVDYQRLMDDDFGTLSSRWKDVYSERSLFGIIHQQRQALALSWIHELGLPLGLRVLEVGCGAGLLAVELTRRGFAVDCLDSSEAMVDLARELAESAGVSDRLAPTVGDAHSLEYPDGEYRLVVALGVLPFLHTPALALREVARVLAPGGYALLSSDNRYRLDHLLDPGYTPPLLPFKRLAKVIVRAIARKPHLARTPWNLFSRRQVDQLLADAGMAPVRTQTLGFGPFSLLGRPLLSEERAIRTHIRLQKLADRGAVVLHGTGAQHIVLAQRY
jgi:2-polyprenyl-3-methyl-5-hydroxy-6-metoxy-1,4-benzoquinol methylase